MPIDDYVPTALHCTFPGDHLLDVNGHIVEHSLFMSLCLGPGEQESLPYFTLHGEADASTIPYDEAFLVARRVIQEICTGCRTLLTREDQKRLLDV